MRFLILIYDIFFSAIKMTKNKITGKKPTIVKIIYFSLLFIIFVLVNNIIVDVTRRNLFSGSNFVSSYGKYELGNSYGVNIRIPSEYQFFPVEYKNDKKTDKKSGITGFNRQIESFSLLVRLPDMRPRDPSNENEIESQLKTNNRFYPWFNISADAIKFTEPYFYWGSEWIGRIKDLGYYYEKNGMYYKESDEKLYGLSSLILMGADKNPFKKHSRTLFYEEKTMDVIIECDTSPKPSPAAKELCKIRFPIYEMNLMVKYSFYRENIASWSENKNRVYKLISGFKYSEISGE